MRAKCGFCIQKNIGNDYWRIKARVRINGKDTAFSTGLELRSRDHWKNGMVFGSERYLMDIYSKLKVIKEEIEAIPCTDYHTPRMVIQMYKGVFSGVGDVPLTLLAAIKYTQKNKRENEDISDGTYREYRSVINRVSKWLSHKKWNDIPLITLRRFHIREYSSWLMRLNGTDKNATAYLHYVIINTSINYVINEFSDVPDMPKVNMISGAIKRPDPHEAKMNSLKNHLSQEIINEIWDVTLSKESKNGAPIKYNIEWFRYVCLFQIYSGFSFVDLGHNNWSVQKDISGGDVIILHRGKNAQEAVIPVSVELRKVIDKMKTFGGDRLFPFEQFVNPMNYKEKDQTMYHAAYGNYSNFLKRLSDRLYLDRAITTHTLRHTFAMRMINGLGMSLESVRVMMGHSYITTTQTYASVSRDRVIEEYRQKAI